MVTSVFLNKCVAKEVFGPGKIQCRIMYCRESCNKKPLKLVLLYSTLNSTSDSAKISLESTFFFEVSALFEVLFKVLFRDTTILRYLSTMLYHLFFPQPTSRHNSTMDQIFLSATKAILWYYLGLPPKNSYSSRLPTLQCEKINK